MHETVSNIERISDHAENIAEYAHERILNNSPFSDTAIDQLRQMAGQVQLALDASVRVLKHEGDVQKARRSARHTKKKWTRCTSTCAKITFSDCNTARATRVPA